MENTNKKIEAGIRFIEKDIVKWNKEFPFYFLGNMIVFVTALLALTVNIFLYILSDGVSGEKDPNVYSIFF
jgi:hypothetical protein